MAGVGTWSQDCHDWTGSGWTPVDPVEPTTFLWQWNGSDGTGGLGTAASGPIGNHAFDLPREARPVFSTSAMFVPGGINADDATVRTPFGIYAVDKTNGTSLWTWPAAQNTQDIQASPAYDSVTNTLLVGSTDGNLYKLNAGTGSVVSTYAAGSAIRKAIRICNGFAYCVCDDGTFHKVTISTMTLAWAAKYAAASAAQTPPVFSVAVQRWVYCTADLYVQCVNDADGSRAWRVKPTTNVPTTDAVGKPLYTYTYGVPVIAEMHQYVSVNMRSIDDRNGIGFGTMSRSGTLTPGTCAEIRSWLQANPSQQSLFAMRLSDGAQLTPSGQPFIPATTWGSNEDIADGTGFAVLNTITAITISGTQATITTQNPHGLVAQSVINNITGVTGFTDNTIINGSHDYSVLSPTTTPAGPAPTSTQFTVNLSSAPTGTYTANSGSLLMNHTAYGTIGNWPVVHVWPNGDEVLYYTFKSFLAATNTTLASQGTDDGRWSRALGEMVLDSSTVAGMSPGDFRWIRAANYVGQNNTGAYQGKSFAIHINDEQSLISGAGSSLFYSHWLVCEGWNITDRSAGKGFNQPFNPIVTTDRRIHMHAPKNAAAYAANHTDTTTSNPTTSEEDPSGRTWPVTGLTYAFNKTGVSRPPLSSGPATGSVHPLGFYWNTTAYSCGFRPRYSIVTDNLVVYVGNGGEITAFTHSGSGGSTTIGIAS